MTADAGTHVAPAHGALPGPSDGLLAELEGAYKDIHAHPELSMQERRTAGIAAAWLRQQGYEATEGVGTTGVVGLLRNGDGATVSSAGPTTTRFARAATSSTSVGVGAESPTPRGCPTGNAAESRWCPSTRRSAWTTSPSRSRCGAVRSRNA